MSVIQAVILGIIQGLTEFLPVSSSGHLFLLERFFGIEQTGLTFEVVLHLGTLVPVFIVFRKEIAALIVKPFQKMTYLLVVATVPTVIFALLFADKLENIFSTGYMLAAAFTLTGILLLAADWFSKRAASSANLQRTDIGYTDAIVIGLMQAVGVSPGVSRSGSTITGALARGLDRETAAKFSFLLAIPAILGGAVLSGKDIISGEVVVQQSEIIAMLFGFIAAMLTGYLAIKFMLAVIKSCKLKYFAFYVFAVAIISFASSLL